MIITCDFETYYSKEFSLSKMTTEEYIRDPSFEVIGVSVKVDDGETVWFSGNLADTKAFLMQYDWANALQLAHNNVFDAAILSFIFDIHPKGLLDTLSMARAVLGVDAKASLAALAERYSLGVKGTEVIQALGKHRADFSATELAKYGQYCCNDTDLCYLLFHALMFPEGLEAAGFPKKELNTIDITLRMFTKPVLELDLPMLEQHLGDVVARKEMLLEAAGANPDDLMSNPKFAKLLEQLRVDPPRKISPTTGKETWAFAKSDEGFKALLEHDDLRVQTLVAARLGNKSTLEETRTQRFIGIAKRGALPVPLKYYGARTGRWAADGSINMQNVPRKSKLKKAIHAPAGHVIVGADLSNIELRVGLWLAGHMDKLELLRTGHDLYKDFAARVFNVPYDEVTKDQRFVGKTSQLSLIYGVGAVKLRSAVKAGSGTDMGEDGALQAVYLYRNDYAKVKAIWGSGTRALDAVLANTTMEFGHNNFFTVEGNKGIRLPSGLLMGYPDLKKQDVDGSSKWDYATRYGRDFIYGAKVFQGCTQAVARCIITEHMFKLAKDMRIALTVHDALYAVVKEAEAEQAMARMLEVMRTPPSWMADIPLDAEAGYGRTLADC